MEILKDAKCDSSSEMETWTYAKAGVDLEKHRKMHEIAHEIIRKLSEELNIEITGLHTYASSFKLGNMEVCIHADGVGTKVMILEKTGKLWVAGWDSMAMNLNDICTEGFRPIVASTYIALPSSDEDLFKQIMDGIYRAAIIGKCVVVGGETAILTDVLNSIDVCCFVLGLRQYYPRELSSNDVVIGIESNGIHANGLTLARKVLLTKYSIDTHIDRLGKTIGEELSRETYIYSELVLELYSRGLIKRAAHITGGAYTKLKRLVTDRKYDIVIDSLPEPPEIFKLIKEEGNISMYEMYRVFNMGIGMILITEKENVDQVLSICNQYNFKAHVVGSVKEGSGNIIVRAYSGEILRY